MVLLWWLIYAISCHFVVTSTFAFRGQKTRRHEKGRQHGRHEIFNKGIFVTSPVKMYLFRLVHFVFSCLVPKVEITTKGHVSCFRLTPFGVKTRKREMALISHHMLLIFSYTEYSAFKSLFVQYLVGGKCNVNFNL